MRILVCGGRDYDDGGTIATVLDALSPGATVVHGAARGADTLAATYWLMQGRQDEAHPADWNRYGKAAGAIRNQEMLDSGIDLVVAFPGGLGTADMVRRALARGVPVLAVLRMGE